MTLCSTLYPQKGVYVRFSVSHALKFYHEGASVRNKVDRSVSFLGLP